MEESTTVPAHTTSVETESVDTTSFSVPDEYKDKAYLKDVNSMDDVFKKLDGAQSLIGRQKVSFLHDDSTEEEIQAFNRSAGMPEKPEEYNFERPDDAIPNEEIDARIKQIFHNAGLSGKAATKVQKEYEGYLNELSAKNDEAFDMLSADVLGDKVDGILASGKKLIEENLPPKLAESFSNLPNEALVTMAAVLENVRQKYITEDNINDSNGVGSGSNGVESLREQGRQLLADPARNNAFHPKHKEVNEKLKEVYGQIGKLSN